MKNDVGGIGADGKLNQNYISAEFQNLHYLLFALSNSSGKLFEVVRYLLLLRLNVLLVGATNVS